MRIVVVLLAAAVGCTSAAGTPSGAAATAVVSVIGTSDLHGALVDVEGRGGLARFGGYLANLRAATAPDGGVLLVDAGDMWQGTMESNLTEGRVVVDAYNALGYDAAAVGNHEFDFGPVGPFATAESPQDDPRGALKARASEARFPFLAANLLDVRTGRPVDWPNVRPSATVDVGGVTVGVIGLATTHALTATIRANTAGLSMAPLAPTAAAEATRLREAGADVIVVVAHAGGSCREFTDADDVSSCDAGSEIVETARALPAGLVDVIVAGHTHAGMAHVVNGIAVIQSFSRGRAFGRVDLTVHRATGTVERRVIHRPQDICRLAEPGSPRCLPAGRDGPAASYEGAAVAADDRVAALIGRAASAVEALKNEALGVHVVSRVPVAGDIESPLGNLFADAMLAVSPGADMALNNTDGGLRADLPAGPLTYGRLYEVFPFDNELVQIRVRAGDLTRVLAAHIARDRRLVGVAGLRVVASCSGTRLTVGLQRPSGTAVGAGETIIVATTDFLATGPLLAPLRLQPGDVQPGPVLRDVIASWFRRRGGAIRTDLLVERGAPRFPARRSLPMTCRG